MRSTSASAACIRSTRRRTDQAAYYAAIGKEFTDHESVDHSKEEWKRGDCHTNTPEGYFSIFKRGMEGVYQHCAIEILTGRDVNNP